MEKANYVAERMICRKIASNPRCAWEFRVHALAEMLHDMDPSVTQPDVKHMLMNCHVTLVEYKTDILFRAEGKSLDGRHIKAIVAVFQEQPRIKVITVF